MLLCRGILLKGFKLLDLVVFVFTFSVATCVSDNQNGNAVSFSRLIALAMKGGILGLSGLAARLAPVGFPRVPVAGIVLILEAWHVP